MQRRKQLKVILNDTLKSKNISQYQLAKMTGISASALNNLCNNKTSSIQFSLIDKICDALDCEISDILKHNKSDTSQQYRF